MPKQRPPSLAEQQFYDEYLAPLSDALIETENLDLQEQWPLTIQLLPEDYLLKLLAIHPLDRLETWRQFAPLALFVLYVCYDYKIDKEDRSVDPVQLVYHCLRGIFYSALAELEAREGHFCHHVEPIAEPLQPINPERPFSCEPKDPNGFSYEAMVEYYQRRALEKLSA